MIRINFRSAKTLSARSRSGSFEVAQYLLRACLGGITILHYSGRTRANTSPPSLLGGAIDWLASRAICKHRFHRASSAGNRKSLCWARLVQNHSSTEQAQVVANCQTRATSKLTLRVSMLLVSTLVMFAGVSYGQGIADNDNELQVRWEFFQTIDSPNGLPTKLLDVILSPDVFTHSRIDLGDLRLYNAANQTVPYALRVLRRDFRRDSFEAEEFNRAEGANNSSEITLDLKRSDLEHNEVEVDMPGSNYRRQVELEGSEDNKTWSALASTQLIQFRRGDEKIDGNTVTYPTSRFRYLRLTVFPDPVVDRERVTIKSVKVVHKVEIPGEMLTLDASLGPREPARGDRGPGSEWIIDLGGNNVPCEQIDVEIDDTEFARNFHIEAEEPPGSFARFYRVSLQGSNFWQRREGEEKLPMVAKFNEVRTSRLKLIVTDHLNDPLKIQKVTFSAPVREVVFEKPSDDANVRLFFGNPEALAPNYDFARNLPSQLNPPPSRAKLSQIETNPAFTPPPVPFTERWPWLIYVVLGAVSLILAVIIISLARKAISIHDGQMETEQAVG